MQRFFIKKLLEWKYHPLRTPLIVRGARQVGKTFAIKAFGKENFESLVYVNFEESSSFQECFIEMNPISIVSQLELICRQKITPGTTLLFLDEIQQCPRALQSLRYFKEKLPALHLIAAGSLLEFAIHDSAFSFPVGRVSFARLYPLSFEEYLQASDDGLLQQTLNSYDHRTPPPLICPQLPSQ